MSLNNDYLRQIANSVGQGDTSGARVLNNEYLRRIAEGIGGIVDPSSGKVDASKIEGVIPAANLPSYVDDVIEGYLYEGAFYVDAQHETEIVPESGKIYVDVSDDTSYRWTGTAYVSMGAPYELPTMTASTKGGAKLGDGLAITDGALGIDPEPQESTGEVRGAVSSLTAKGWATQDGTPTPESPVAIQVARGRNLIDSSRYGTAANIAIDNYSNFTTFTITGVTFTRNSDGSLYASGTASAVTVIYLPLAFELPIGTQIALSGCPSGGSTSTFQVDPYYTDNTFEAGDVGSGFSKTITKPLNRVRIRIASGQSISKTFYPQLELGSTPTPYVPYGHVGIEARQGSTLISAIHVPLPSKGYAAALPDGTADVLTIDGAGKVEWASAVARIESYDGESVGATYLSTTGSLTTGAEVYYPLATPATEDFGYIDWPTIPDGATITCPELDALGVRYLIGNGVAEMARQWYERARSEYEDRIASLEDAVAQLITEG